MSTSSTEHNHRMLTEMRSLKGNLKKGATTVHVTALDAVMNVNSFFTIAVFLGLSLTAPNQAVSINPYCSTKKDAQKYLLMFEVLSFSCFLLSTLVAHGMKLFVVIANSRDENDSSHGTNINARFLRCGMMGSAIGSVAGTVFLVLSMICVVEIRLGSMGCGHNSWSERTIIPMIILVGTGVLVFVLSAIYDFLH